MEDAELLERFEAADLTMDQWNHRRHVRVAWCYLNQLPVDEALAKMRAGLKALLPVFGLEDSLTTGYHETITVAWLRIIADLMARHGGHATSQEFLSENTQLGSKRVLRFFYSKERLVSERAKREFLEPDIVPLPPVPGDHDE